MYVTSFGVFIVSLLMFLLCNLVAKCKFALLVAMSVLLLWGQAHDLQVCLG